MAFPRVYVNGALAGEWDYGYASFHLDVTAHLRPGQRNVLAVHADTRPHDSRWYPGAGIYRKVRMVAVNIGEDKDTITDCLTRLNISPYVAMDESQRSSSAVAGMRSGGSATMAQ
mgnify:CR=1 FL=1